MSDATAAGIRQQIQEALVVLAAPEADRVMGLIRDLEQAVRTEERGNGICELPHRSIEEEEACEQGRLSEGGVQVSPGVRSRYSEEYLKRINQGRRR